MRQFVSDVELLFTLYNQCFAGTPVAPGSVAARPATTIDSREYFTIEDNTDWSTRWLHPRKVHSKYTRLDTASDDISLNCVVCLQLRNVIKLLCDYQDIRGKPDGWDNIMNFNVHLYDGRNVFMEELKYRLKEISKKNDNIQTMKHEIDMVVAYVAKVQNIGMFKPGGGGGDVRHMSGVIPDILDQLIAAQAILERELQKNPFPVLVKTVRRETLAIILNSMEYLLRILRNNSNISRLIANIAELRDPDGEINRKIRDTQSGALLATLAHTQVFEILFPKNSKANESTLTKENEIKYRHAIAEQNPILDIQTKSQLARSEDTKKDQLSYTHRHTPSNIEVPSNVSPTPLCLKGNGSGTERHFWSEDVILNLFLELHGLLYEFTRDLLFLDSGILLSADVGDATFRGKLMKQAFTMAQCHLNVANRLKTCFIDLHDRTTPVYRDGTNNRIKISPHWKKNKEDANTIFGDLQIQLGTLIENTEKIKVLAENGLSSENVLALQRHLSFFVATSGIFEERTNPEISQSILSATQGTPDTQLLDPAEQLCLRRMATVASLGFLFHNLPDGFVNALCRTLGIDPSHPDRRNLVLAVFENSDQLSNNINAINSIISKLTKDSKLNTHNFTCWLIQFLLIEDLLAKNRLDKKAADIFKQDFVFSITENLLSNLGPTPAFLIGLGLLKSGDVGIHKLNKIYDILRGHIDRMNAEYKTTREEKKPAKTREIAMCYLYLCLLDLQQQYVKYDYLYITKQDINILEEFQAILVTMKRADHKATVQLLSDLRHKLFDGGKVGDVVSGLTTTQGTNVPPAVPERSAEELTKSAADAEGLREGMQLDYLKAMFRLLDEMKRNRRLTEEGAEEHTRLFRQIRQIETRSVGGAVSSAEKNSMLLTRDPLGERAGYAPPGVERFKAPRPVEPADQAVLPVGAALPKGSSVKPPAVSPASPAAAKGPGQKPAAAVAKGSPANASVVAGASAPQSPAAAAANGSQPPVSAATGASGIVSNGPTAVVAADGSPPRPAGANGTSAAAPVPAVKNNLEPPVPPIPRSSSTVSLPPSAESPAATAAVPESRAGLFDWLAGAFNRSPQPPAAPRPTLGSESPPRTSVSQSSLAEPAESTNPTNFPAIDEEEGRRTEPPSPTLVAQARAAIEAAGIGVNPLHGVPRTFSQPTLGTSTPGRLKTSYVINRAASDLADSPGLSASTGRLGGEVVPENELNKSDKRRALYSAGRAGSTANLQAVTATSSAPAPASLSTSAPVASLLAGTQSPLSPASALKPPAAAAPPPSPPTAAAAAPPPSAAGANKPEEQPQFVYSSTGSGTRTPGGRIRQ